MQGPKRLTTILLTLALAAGTASADRVHHWRLDETTGDTAYNSAGFQDGQLQNTPLWQPTQGLDGALQCDQDDDGVALGVLDLSSSFTIMGWSRPVPQSARWGRFVNSSHMTGCYLGFKPVDDDNYWHLLVQLAGPIGGNITGPLVTYNNWQHVAAVYNRTTMQATLYVNGTPYGPVTASPPSLPIAATYLGKDKTGSPAILGLYDDVAIFDSALTTAQIQAVYTEGLAGHAINYWQAANPSPADNATDVPLDATLSWSAGANPPQPITAHILYYGTDPEYVFRSQLATLLGDTLVVSLPAASTSHAPGFPNDRTMYWRVDEKIDADTIAPGPLWQFTTHSNVPLITQQPTDCHAILGRDAAFSLTAASEIPGETYQWYKQENPLADIPGRITGATSPTLTITNVEMADAARYHAVVNNPAGFVASDIAYLILPQTFCNPLDVKAADIFIDRFDGTYYLYATGSLNYDINAKGCPIWSSPDLVNWRLRGLTYPPHAQTWAQYWFWGAECHYKDGLYYLYHTGFRNIDGQDVGRISVATSTSPTGPFQQLKAPMFDWDIAEDVIAPSVFTDDDGSRYIYVTVTEIGIGNVMYGAQLDDDMVTLASTPQLCIQPTQPWEGHVTEGTKILKHEDTYYFTYSGDDFRQDYALGYATGPTPLGPWTKYPGNPIMKGTAEIQKPGSHCFIHSPDGRDMFVAYHSQLQPPGHIRALNLSRVHFENNPAGGPDILVVERPASKTPQAYPSGVPFTRMAVDDEFSLGTVDFNIWTNIWAQSRVDYPFIPGQLVLDLFSGSVRDDRADGRDVFLQLAPYGLWSITTKVTLDAQQNGEAAFLTVWQDPDNYLALKTNYLNRKNLEVAMEQAGVYSTVIQAPNLIGNTIYLRIRKTDDNTFQCYTSQDGLTWNALGPEVQLALDDTKVGLGAWLEDSTRTGITATFDFFRVEHLSPLSDTNADRLVDGDDLSCLCDEWLEQNDTIRPQADFTQDGKVNMQDYGILHDEWDPLGT